MSNHDGTLGAETNFVPGYVREAFNLDGVDDYVSILDKGAPVRMDSRTGAFLPLALIKDPSTTFPELDSRFSAFRTRKFFPPAW